MKRIFRRRAADQSRRAGVASLFGGRARGERLRGYERAPSFGLRRLRKRLAWVAPATRPGPPADPAQITEQVAATAALPSSFQDRSRLRRRLRFLRRARELGLRDVGGLIFDMRRFERNRPDLVESKLEAMLAVDRELRTLERILGDRRTIHVLHEPGISACPRCGALHSSDSNFCPQCGLTISGPRAMGELGGAIAAPPKPPPAPAQQERPGPSPAETDHATARTIMQPASAADQPTVSYAPARSREEHGTRPPADPQDGRATDGGAAHRDAGNRRAPANEGPGSGEKPAPTDAPPWASGGS